MKYLVIGTTFIDIKGFPEGKFIREGRNSGQIEYVLGGVGRNIAENLGRLGRDCDFISVVDDSPFGQDVIKGLKEEGVGTDYVPVVKDSLGTWLAVFDDEGDVAASISKRSDLSALLKLFDQYGEEIFQDADGILLEIDIEAEIVDRVFGFAARYQLPVYAVISNMGIAMERGAFLHPISCFVCNGQEAEMMLETDLRNLPMEDISELIRVCFSTYDKRLVYEDIDNSALDNRIMNSKPLDNSALENKKVNSKPLDNSALENKEVNSKHLDNSPLDNKNTNNKPIPNELNSNTTLNSSVNNIERIVVTLGEKGAVYYDRTSQLGGWIPAEPVEVVDTTGAGDAFFTGVSIGLTEGKGLREACQIGAKLASSVITSKGNVVI